jgi:hypothetical protein
VSDKQHYGSNVRLERLLRGQLDAPQPGQRDEPVLLRGEHLVAADGPAQHLFGDQELEAAAQRGDGLGG